MDFVLEMCVRFYFGGTCKRVPESFNLGIRKCPF